MSNTLLLDPPYYMLSNTVAMLVTVAMDLPRVTCCQDTDGVGRERRWVARGLRKYKVHI